VKIDKVHCLFEQSGTFKNEFKKLGYAAEDYDILNDFGETDHIVDLFAEIDKAYEGEPSIFNDMSDQDLILAFFPCTRFEDQIIMGFRGELFQMKNWSDLDKVKYARKLHFELSELYDKICKLFIICLRGRQRLIVENPYSTQHYLVRYFPIKSSMIDKDRHKNGDYYKKPTQYWFINCKPELNLLFEPIEPIERKRVEVINDKVARSLIHPQYANRFIREFIL